MTSGPGKTDVASSAPGVERSTIAVLTNTVATGALGASFWLIAAALFDEDVVAASIAASSVLIAISFLAQLNLNTGLSRFLPAAGARQRWIVTAAYTTSLRVAAVAAAVTVAVGIARGGSIVTGGDIGLTIVVACSIPVWVVFSLQDGALVALRKAQWLAVENGLTTVAKLALLFAFVALPGRFAIMLAWTLPAIPAVYLVNRIMYRRLLDPGRERGDSSRGLVRYAIADLPGSAANLLSLRVVPLVIVEAIPGDAKAYVAVPWSILTVAALSLGGISRVVLSEMSHHPERARAVSARSTRFIMMLFGPGALVGAALAGFVLGFAGEGYSSQGGPVLALGLLGLVPAALIECRFAVFRFEGRMFAVMQRQIARGVLLITSTTVLLLAGRPTWIGGAFLAVNAAMLVVVRLSTPTDGGTELVAGLRSGGDDSPG